ncbi:Exodeoxyribonuclease VII large subunit [Ignavibacterium album JCM 16511]|uniref:Exodeoxyribonuclease 7 large subunit n=1 Tax=Ignavibacterium album (strain DSM 19864 / JCM 16511 / NBRC 101810 / Mat9-16) TaxID=945713 RepID=I0ALI4_IGNAJ|nr:exodeoxyribonuclease VII large subunit [Ignavibacterium album]AFH49841.1 Exodeoxyribonuclease VII large subunit [Ignavibacterium album JCM 16511]
MNEEKQIFTVSELTQSIKFVLESAFDNISVEGEISNFKSHISGHWYFNLKDENAVINCTMWRGLNNYVFFTPQDGMKVVVTGRITVYPPRGNYQVDVRSMKPAGEGELQAAFERLKQKLKAEGLFEEERKRKIPFFPNKIGIVTAIDGAAIRDMISVAKRRFPLVELIIVPTKVQGSGAAEDIVDSLSQLNKLKDIDVIIVARGGGSIEDLWAFNEEIVARAIYNSKIPVITGIGHEIDFTIADFVSDLRAPTPSVAMEIATPDSEELLNAIKYAIEHMEESVEQTIADYRQRINDVLDSYMFRYPLEKVRNFYQKIDNLFYKISQQIDKKILLAERETQKYFSVINSYDIEKTLKKGFALIKQDDKFVTRKQFYNPEKPVSIKFYDGEIKLEKK